MHWRTVHFVIPPGLEPRSSEPESDILSIELWDQMFVFHFHNSTKPEPDILCPAKAVKTDIH